MISILLVDDRHLTILALQNILATAADLNVVGEVNSGSDALKFLETERVDIAIVDLNMPEMDGLTLTQIICDRFAETKVIILSGNDDNKSINQAIISGARGYLLKDKSQLEIVNTIRSVHQGYFQLGPGLSEKIMADLINTQKQTAEYLATLEATYNRDFAQLEREIAYKHERSCEELSDKINFDIDQIKLKFKDSLETFQKNVTEQLEQGFEALNNRHHRFDLDTKKLEQQINDNIYERHLYITNKLDVSRKSIHYLENQVNWLRKCLLAIVIIYFIEKIILFVV